VISFLIQTLRWFFLRNTLTYRIDPPWRKRPNLAENVQRRDYFVVGGEKQPKTKPDKKPIKPKEKPKPNVTTGENKPYTNSRYNVKGYQVEEWPAPIPPVARSILQVAESLTGRKIYFIIGGSDIHYTIYLAMPGDEDHSGFPVKVGIEEGYLNSSDEARTVLIVKALKELLYAEQETTSADKLGRIICDAAIGHSLRSSTFSDPDSVFFGDDILYGRVFGSSLHGIDPGLGHKLTKIWLDGESSGTGSVRQDRNSQVRAERLSLEEDPDKTASQDRLL
jgi:hypothetical protein